MAISEREILDTLAKAVAEKLGGSLGVLSSTRFEKSESKDPRSQKERSILELSKRISDFKKGIMYTTNMLPKKIRESFDKSGSEFVKKFSDNIKDLGDVLKLEDQAKAMAAVAARLKQLSEKDQTKYFESREEALAALEEVAKEAQKAGMTLEDMGVKITRHWDFATKKNRYFINDQINTYKKVEKQAEELSDALEKAHKTASEEIEKHTYRVEKNREALAAFGSMIKKSIELGEEEARFAMSAATADAGLIKGVKDLGISQIEYMKILKDTRREQLAMVTAGVDFYDVLKEATDSTRGYSSSNLEAAKAAAGYIKNLSAIGVSQDLLGDAIKQQSKMYTENYRALGYTTEEFNALTADLINDRDIQQQLITLREKERLAFIQGLQQRMVEYQTMGYSIERAKELQKVFSSLIGMSPKERMKQAAKQRAMLGALGMGEEAQRLFEMQIRYRTMSEEERAKADIEMAKIQKEAASRFLEVSAGPGVSLGQSMAMQQLAINTGFDKTVQVFQAESEKGRTFLERLIENTNEVPEIISTLIGFKDTFLAGMNSSATYIVTALLGGLTALLGKNLIGSIVSAFTKGGPGGKGGLFGRIGKGVKTFGKGIGGIGSSILGAGASLFGLGGEGIAETVAPKGAKEAAEAAGKKGLGKTLGKTAGKSILKKIPVIGAFAGLGFAAGRAMQGDWLGALGEAASGIASIVPGIGTAVSTAIDAGLAARDVIKSQEGIGRSANQTVEEEQTQQATLKSQLSIEEILTQKQQLDQELLATLKEIKSYIKTINEQNAEQAEAVRKTGEAALETLRFSSINGRRPPV